MQKNFSYFVQQLQKIIFIYDGIQIDEKINCLKSIAKTNWKTAEELKEYIELLLFISSHPESIELDTFVEKEFNRITTFLQNLSQQKIKQYSDAGFPYSEMYTQLSHDILCWMNQQKNRKLSIESFDESGIELNTLLRTTLLSLEREETMAGLSNQELLDVLKIKPSNQFSFLLNEFSKLNPTPFIKDHLWDSLKLWVTIQSTDKSYSRIYNRIPVQKKYFQKEIIKKFDSEKLINTPIPSAKKLNQQTKKQLISVIKNSLTLTMRETDPATYMNENSLQYFELEKGISIALYDMTADRQLPLQSYIGYTLFKNGYPMAYGGSWIFGNTARFGLNIFEAFRGGESGYTMCQLLRVYKQVYGMDVIEVDSYMFGKNNPDGIQSGAFWFYYRFGFRLIDEQLQQLAEKEMQKIKSKPGYRTSPKTLLQFTDSDIRLTFNKHKQINRIEILEKVSNLFAIEFHGDRLQAEKICIQQFLKKAKTTFTSEQQFALTEFSIVAKAMKWNTATQTKQLIKSIQSKSVDSVEYNNTLKLLLK